MEMDVETGQIAGTAVQIGHPIMEKQVQEVILRARDEGLYTAITDSTGGLVLSTEVAQLAYGELINTALSYAGVVVIGPPPPALRQSPRPCAFRSRPRPRPTA